MSEETATTIGDALIFVAIVAVVILVGIAVGMIVAGRLDRIMAPRPPAEDPAVSPGEPGHADDTPGDTQPDTTTATAEEEHP